MKYAVLCCWGGGGKASAEGRWKEGLLGAPVLLEALGRELRVEQCAPGCEVVTSSNAQSQAGRF